jgi:flavodoxin
LAGVRIKLQGPIEDTWSHGEKYKSKGWICAYCGDSKESGGKTRFTQHLAGLQGEVVPCGKVSAYVRQIMLDVHANGRKNRLSTQECRLYVEKAIMKKTYEEDRRKIIPRDEAGQVKWALRESMRIIGQEAALHF